MAVVTHVEAIEIFANRQPVAGEMAELEVQTSHTAHAICSVPRAQAAVTKWYFSGYSFHPGNVSMTFRQPKSQERLPLLSPTNIGSVQQQGPCVSLPWENVHGIAH